MIQSTPQAQFENGVAESLAQLASGDAPENSLRQRHPSARYRDPHPVFQLSNSLLSWALSNCATGMQVISSPDSSDVFFDAAGVLQPIASMPPTLHQPIVSRFMDMATVDVTSEAKIQQGTIHMLWQGKEYQMTAKFLPASSGINVILWFAAK